MSAPPTCALRSFTLSTMLICCTPAIAQWSHNSAVNFGISTAASDQNQAKVLSIADGQSWVVWLDGIGTGWNTVVQKLDAVGRKLLPGNGVIVADTAFSSTQDYGAAVDDDGNLYLAYRDDKNNGSPVQIKIQKLAPDGSLLWGSGVQVSSAANGNAPHCCATSDGGAVVAWSNPTGGAQVQKVNSQGAAQWVAGGVADPQPTGLYFVCDVVSDNAGGAIVSYHHQTGGFSSPRHLKAQRFASRGGAKTWNGGLPLVIYDAGSLQLGAFPALVADGNGGAVTAWYNVAGTRNAYAQHVTSDGVELFPHNGAAVAIDVANRIRISASAAIDADTGEVFMIARESGANPQGNYSIIAQKFDAAGTRQWGNTGVLLIPQGANQPGFEQAVAVSGGGAIFAWYIGGNNNQNVFATRLDGSGSTLWSRTVSSAASAKARLASTGMQDVDGVVLAWADNRTDANDIYGQRVNLDGSLGTPGDVNDDGDVDGADLGLLLAAWDECPAFCPGDLNENGVVDGEDLGVLLSNWS